MLLLPRLLIKSSARRSGLCSGEMKGMSQPSAGMQQGGAFPPPPTGFPLFWRLSRTADPHIWPTCAQKQRWQSRIKGTVTTKFVKRCFPYGVRSKLVRNKVLPEFFSFNVHLLMFNTPFWGRPDFGCPARHASEHVLHVLSRMSAALLLALFIVAFKGQSGVRFSDFCILSAPV